MVSKSIHEVVSKYYNEANGGIVDKAPSCLKRGEGTEIAYYIFKIDLVGSTNFTRTRRLQTYLKLAHTFLSTVHEITKDFGADNDQVEYVGDSIIAYFRASKVQAIEVVKAAYFCREATLEIRKLDTTLSKFPFQTKCVLHYGQLIMAKIGPRGEAFASAIGPHLHKACKMELKVGVGQGLVSKEFRDQLEGKQRLLLTPNYVEKQVPKQIDVSSAYSASRLEAFRKPTPQEILQGMAPKGIAAFSKVATPTEATYEIKKEVVDFSLKWDLVPKYLYP